MTKNTRPPQTKHFPRKKRAKWPKRKKLLSDRPSREDLNALAAKFPDHKAAR